MFPRRGKEIYRILRAQGKMTARIEDALAAYTVNGAYSSYEEALKGSITVGKLADMVVLSANPLKIPAASIKKDVECLYTIVGGEVVFQR